MQTIAQTFNADGSSITISINVHLPFALVRAAAGAPCCGCRCPRSHSGGGTIGLRLTGERVRGARYQRGRGWQGWRRRPRDDDGLGTDRLARNTRRLGLRAVPVGCRLVHQIAEPEPRTAAIDIQESNERDEQSEPEPRAAAIHNFHFTIFYTTDPYQS